MKKFVSMLSVAVLSASLLCACGGGTESTTTAAPPAGDTTGAAVSQEETGTPATTSAPTDGDVIVMKLANANPAGDIRDQVCRRFADLAAEKTGGKVKIEVYSGGSLGDWRDAVEGLSMGINEIVIEGIATLSAYTDLAYLDGLPYVFRDADHFQKVMLGEMGQEICDQVGEQGGFKLLGPQYRGTKVTTSQKPFSNLEELKGLKIRVPNNQVNIDTWTYLGASPTPLALTETFTALQQHTVEAQENSIIESYGHGFYDVCDYLIYTDHQHSADVFIFDRNYFNDLDPEIQQALTEAANEAAQWRTETVLKEEKEYLTKWEEAGVEIIYPELDGLREAVANLAADKYPMLKDMVDQIQAVQ
ncbi:TRAP transporter substrate-binding protein [Hominifimenecus sp. rT4P-3]|uniref:TRAP transporter substrate-binding protein n=1 Tax=Hominifimenecus sp. rT4P-3 TaxID=3242979 RepID=UPI003DA2CEE6